jgi:hypothetical protein
MAEADIRELTSHGPQAVMLPPDDPVLPEMVRRLVDELHPERIYLFGSRTRGDAAEESDYDFMVFMERVGPPYEIERRVRQVPWDMPQPMDIVVVTHEHFEWMLGAAAPLPATVEREGLLLYAC